MLRVEDVHVLRHKVLVEGLSRRQAARELGISRNTVRRYLRLPEPLRVEREPRRKPVLERVQPRLDALLEEWSGRTTAKQIGMRATSLHRQLREEGYEAGEHGLVRDYLREWRRRRAEVYVPLVHRPERRGAGPDVPSRSRSSWEALAPQGLEVPDAADVLRAATSSGSTTARTQVAFLDRPRAGGSPTSRRGARAHRLRQPSQRRCGACSCRQPAPAHRALCRRW